MKACKTYQECKIENPDGEVAVVARTDEFTPPLGDFISVLRTGEGLDGYSFVDKSKSGSPNISDGYYKICDPADYCMTVEEFLSSGHEFVDGDLMLGADGAVWNDMHLPIEWNFEVDDGDNSNRHILRAAALDKKPRTKVEFVKVTESIFDLKDEFERGELYFSEDVDSYILCNSERDLICSIANNNIYRKIEKEIDERQEFIDVACSVIEDYHGERRQYVVEALYDSGKFKLVN